LLPIRITASIVFIAHGIPKFYDISGRYGFFQSINLPPELFIPIGLLEVIGGLAILFGILTYLYSIHLSVGFYLDNYTNNSVTNEKFVIAMLICGGILLYWGKFRNTSNLNNFGNDTKNFN
jgi:uncharacterized membrane protein YphA (DoxX/SURF4 family)